MQNKKLKLYNIFKLSVLYKFLFFSSVSLTSQTYHYPVIDKKSDNDITIESIVLLNDKSIINFRFINSSNIDRYILLNSPGHKNAFYIKHSNGLVFKLLYTNGISSYDGNTIANKNQPKYFSATFERLPLNTTKFDLIEGESGDWNFFGVKLKSDDQINSEAIETAIEAMTTALDSATGYNKSFTYNNVSVYNHEKKTWSQWKKQSNLFEIDLKKYGSFVMQSDENDDNTYTIISDIQSKETIKKELYKSFEAKDDLGNIFKVQLFDDVKLGLKLIAGGEIIQFIYK